MGTLMDQTPNEVTHLIDRLRAGDRQALGELFHSYRERLRRMVELRMDARLRTRLDASDVLQEAYLDLAGDLETYRADPKLPPLIQMVGEQFDKMEPGASRSAHVGMSASNIYIFFTQVLPVAIKKYGGGDGEALRKAALDVDNPEGGTMMGFGVKFAGESEPMAGQNMRAFPVVTQYVDGKAVVVWPKSQQQAEPVLPLPAGTTYSNK